MPEPVVGILMLKTAFPRPPGDIGNPDTWPFPVRYAVVEPATVARDTGATPLALPQISAPSRSPNSTIKTTVSDAILNH